MKKKINLSKLWLNITATALIITLVLVLLIIGVLLVNGIDIYTNKNSFDLVSSTIYAALFGTVLMVFLMAIIVMPLGVITAIYLHEYAPCNKLTKFMQLTIINLAGVPSIVYGLFGLGFFVYYLGGIIDKLAYSETLPLPTFGTPGILWSAMTLAILTLPVVIVATQDGLARISQQERIAAYALGATKAEVVLRIILPQSLPAILTAFILAIARAGGEVAPLMLVGAVKIAPNLPLDANFPYLHLDRQFMHLGYYLYDLTMQGSLNTDSSLVFGVALLLLLVTLGLNFSAIMWRRHWNLRNSKSRG